MSIDCPPRSRKSAECHSSSSERDEADRRERGAAGHRGREAQASRAATPRRARLPQAQREERGGGQEDVEARLGVPGEELQRHDGGQAEAGQQPRPADEALREQEQPRQQRPDAMCG